MRTPPGIKFLVDSNEVAGDHLGYALDPAEVRKLPVGDYSVMLPDGTSLENEVSVERKSLVNLLGDSCGENRERFERFLARFGKLRYPALIVEASWSEILAGNFDFTRLDPRAASGSLIAWSMRFRVPVWMVDSRKEGMELTRRLLVRATLEVARLAQSTRQSGSDGGSEPSGASPPVDQH